MAAYNVRKKAEAVIIIAFIFSLILIPAIIHLQDKPESIKPLDEEKYIREKFSRLRKLDSLSYWDGDKSWIKEYAGSRQMTLKDYIEQTNIQFRERIHERKYKWFNNYSQKWLSIDFRINEQDLATSVAMRESIRDFSRYLSRAHDYLINDFILYSSLYLQDRMLLDDFIFDLKKIPLTSGDIHTETAYNVITMIQSLEYINMKKYRLLGDSLIYSSNGGSLGGGGIQPDYGKYLKTGIKDSRKQEARYIKHELFTPVEALTYGKADCDTRTLLAYTILKGMGFDVATMRIHFYDNGKSSWHGMLGIAGVKNSGPYFFTYKNKKYYYVELTRTNWRIGEITPDQKNYGRLIGLDLPVPAIRWGGLDEKR